MQENATEQVEEVRRKALAVLDDLVERAGEFELAEPPEGLVRYRHKLRENAYKVLVVGEAKRGKSTFVNALIGRDVLPTDVNVATSQVFSIRPSEREAYRLRFEDGSVREIPPEDLPLYGSQVVLDAGAVPTADQIIRWIEVDVPIRFLPDGVSILDTPGLGTLYAGHARITHRFVPEADAVIFVLESGQPIVDEDLKFIEEILSVTCNIFFVQTKIDQYSKEDWQNVQHRNQEILATKFKGRLTDTRIWPISSTNLRKAAGEDRRAEAYLMVSQYEGLMTALEAFLARVAGWGRVAEALMAAGQYHGTGRKALAGRLAGLSAEDKQRHSELQKVAVEAKRRFDADWGAQGRKYRELREGLQRAITVGKQSFANTLQPYSDIELAQKAKIDEISSLKEANRVAEEMPNEVVTAVINSWSRVCGEVQDRCAVLLGPFAEAVEDAGAPIDPDLLGLAMPGDEPDERFGHDYFGMFRGAAGGGMLVMGMSSMGSLVMPAVATAALATAAPFVAPAVIAGLVYGGVKGVLKGQVKTAQGQLKMRLAELLQKVRRHFFDVDLTAGNFSRVDEYFRTLERTVNDQVRELVEKKSKESQAEIARLQGTTQLDDRERAARKEQAQGRLDEWEEIGKSGGAVVARIKALQGPGAPAKAPAKAAAGT